MALAWSVMPLVICIFVSSCSSRCFGSSSSSKEVYVVYMGAKVHAKPEDTLAHHHSVLASAHEGSLDAAKESLIYSYKHGFSGFAAKLSGDQAAALSGRPGVVSVFKSRMRQLHTTRSWEFLGLPPSEVGGIPHAAKQHKAILGLFDTGIWPESSSFRDEGMPPVPEGWRGRCEAGENFTAAMCNRKLIGARYYLRGLKEQAGPLVPFKHGGADILSPRDSVGHGSHTASTAAGRFVKGVSFQGLAKGVKGARGGAPLARIAAYKVCWSPGCFDADLLAAFDDAIHDGVHVLSLSLGPDPPQADFFMDAISIGSFHAMRASITVVGSVGNNGPSAAATNVAPWILTVASTSIDRTFPARVILGNNAASLEGVSLSILHMNSSAQLITGKDAARRHAPASQAMYCMNNTLDPSKVGGKVVVCRHTGGMEGGTKVGKSAMIHSAGGAGMILIDELDKEMGVHFLLPAIIVGSKAAKDMLSYMNYTRLPTAFITRPTTELGIKPAPQVSVFSSRGPNTVTPDVLKPDIAAPGLNILAAWSPINMGLDYNIVSGTSMACPHISGVALLLKASQPFWSPAAIKSAMVTTAFLTDNEDRLIGVAPFHNRTASPFDMGGGQVHAKRAQNPGLIYDIDGQDYIDFLCASGYDTPTLQLVTSDHRSSCASHPNSHVPTSPADLNYPLFAVSSLIKFGLVKRTATNVGNASSTYHVRVQPPAGVEVRVLPSMLVFRHFGQKLSFYVEFRVRKPADDYVFGSITWSDGRHKVRSFLALNTRSVS